MSTDARIPCSRCQHWEPPSPRPDINGNIDPFGECGRASSSLGRPDDPETLAFASDMESYGAALRTKPAFSCSQAELRVHHNPEAPLQPPRTFTGPWRSPNI